MTRDPVVVCVIGMHRSGTSLATGILRELGMYLGSERNMMAPAADNPKGFFELDPVRDLNDEILAALGGAWDDPPSLPSRWERRRDLRPLRERAAQLVGSEFQGRDRWAWKDPRASLTLPLWRRVTPPMRFVVCVRNPLEVAGSLERRNGIPIARGAGLWLTYTAAALRHTAGEERLLISFEELLEDRRRATVELAGFAGLEVTADAQRRVDGFVSAELRHEEAGAADALGSDDVPPRAKALYGALLAAIAGARTGTRDPALEDALRDLSRA